MAERTRALQQALLDLALGAGSEAAFAADPRDFGARRGLGAPDQAALALQAPRLKVYRALVRNTLAGPLEDCFPLGLALLREAGTWRDCLEAFLDSRSIQGLRYVDIPPLFVAWLAESGWGAERFPWLLQLAHYEELEMELTRHPDGTPASGLSLEPDPGDSAVFDPTVRNLAYGWAVHEADEDDPMPEARPVHLLCFRDTEARFRTLELTPHTSALLARLLEGEPIGPAAEALGLSPDEVTALLRDLRADGAIQGFTPAG